jgi:Sulfotransferase family
VRVLYVSGSGRSGSTLLERLLGQIAGVTAVGEVVDLWNRGVLANERCGCSRPFDHCPFWTDVGARAFGGWDRTLAAEYAQTQASVIRHALPTWITEQPPRRERAQYDALLTALGRVYGAITEVANANVVVDTSKRAAYASLLSASGVDLRVVQLIRDPRAVVFSMEKVVERPHAKFMHDFMHHPSSIRAAFEWVFFNEANRVLSAKGMPVLHLRYEDLVADPNAALDAVCDHAGIARPTAATGPRISGDGFVELPPSHALAGNPMRFDTGRVRIAADEEWRTNMRTADRYVTTAVTAPWLARYGYRARV